MPPAFPKMASRQPCEMTSARQVLALAVAFQQRRQQVVGDCWQLKQDVDSFNQNNKPSQLIQMIFDFTDDLAEMKIS